MIEIRPAGDTGWLVSVGGPDRPDHATVRRVRMLKARVDRAAVPGVSETHLGYRSLLVSYDPVAVNPGSVRTAIARIAEGVESGPPPQRIAGRTRVRRFPLCVCPECALDRGFIGATLGMAWDEFVRRYCGHGYEVWFMGFQPGFPFLGLLPEGLDLPRHETPRTFVPAGSVGIGGFQTGIYAESSPGGWRVLGRTNVRLFDPGRKKPALLAPGDGVAFDPTEDHRALFR
jgi:KipI family sensor histidine kinase inhibitor